jgi:hypothetical protein
MSDLSLRARRRSLQLRLVNIERKIVRVQEEIHQLEQGLSPDGPGLFGNNNPAMNSLKDNLEHLKRVARQIREEV